jgi:energy-coupling factor transport system substrate-specific component
MIQIRRINMSNRANSMNKGLSVKDLVTTGIFTALVFVFILIGGMFFATNPVLTFFMPAGSGLLAGPAFLLMIAKVQKRWSLSIMGVVIGILWFVTGMHWAFVLGYLLMAIVADFVAGAGKYRSKKLNSLAYILFSLGSTGTYILFFVDPNGWAQTMLGNGTEQSYIDTMQATANTGILIAMFAAVLITSAISAFVGCKLLKKQFEKAGITA